MKHFQTIGQRILIRIFKMTLRRLCALSRASKLCIVLSLLSILHFATYYFLNENTNLLTNPNSPGNKYIRFYDQNSTITLNKQIPKILYWKSFDNITGIAECAKTCPYKCDITDDESQIETADAVLFHLVNLWSENWVIGTKKNIPFPTYRRPDQVWVMFNFEPPPNLFGDLHIFDGLFNWTMGYRKDSTLFQPYGFSRTLDENEAKMAELEFKNRNFYKEKTNNISCMISNCKDAGQRYRTVDKLSKYIHIDKYGKCYKKECGDYRKPETCESVIKTYKFYLGLENSRCKDYVTEKYWYAMRREQIPIVNWDFDHIDESIPIQGSFISISDFKSLQELAKYIEKVNSNETLYNSYFNWKKKYRVDIHCGACIVCEALHKTIKPQVIEDFAGWMSDDVCDKVDTRGQRTPIRILKMTLRTLCAKTALSRASFYKLRNLFGRKLCIVLSLLTILHFSTYYFLNVKTNLLTNPNSRGIKYIRFDDQNSTITPNKQTPKLLYWKSFDNITGIAECAKTCPYKCDVTDDLSQIETADAVLFQLMNLWSENWVIGTKKNIPFPTYRRPDQVWVMFNFEPPPNLFGDLHIFDGLFNWTMSYRKDSTLFQPYGFYRTLNESEAKMAELEFKNRNFYKEKTNNISCMISNCKDTGQRYRTVDKLSKYINIDKYGKCYKKECGDYRKPETCESVIKTYKFYLGLENSRCKDYVTEKYWYSMLREQIPIVNWDFDHIDESIPIQGSFISISDFKSLQELAKYIEKVNNNETLYNSYFNWKKKYMIDFHCGACTVCEALHKPIKPQVIEDFAGWMSDDVCDKVDNFNILKVKLNEYLFWKLGI